MAHVFFFLFSPSAPSQKINRRLHLSKVKHSKFNESGQLVAFHLTSMVWCLYVVVTVRHGAGWILGSVGWDLGFLERKTPMAAEESPQPAPGPRWAHFSKFSLQVWWVFPAMK